MSGHGVQIVKVLNDHTYQLDEKLLEQILLKPEIKDLPVVVVSVAGAYRGGKSFLLNFFIRYLSAPDSARRDGSWLGEDSAPLVGFNWRGGVMRNTTGILIWSEPFVNTLPNGQKVVVLLMDTQGTFDSKSTVRDNSTIFALSTLTSSVQIYNMANNIQEDDLQHLQLFTMYGKMVQERNQGGKAFQKLEFLVRDWPYPYDYPFGAEGGMQLLQQRLEITPDLPKELQDLRTHISSSFEEVLCFLMPHPGFKVLNPAFKGNISEIQPDFRTHLKSLVSSLLSTEKLSPKTINGQNIKAGELFNYFKAYMTLFNSNQIPNPRNIMQATAEAGLLSSMNEARVVYEKGMDAECGPTKPGVPSADVQDLHRKYLAAAKAAFNNKRTLASPEEANTSMNKIITELDNRLPQYEQSNMSKLQTVMKDASSLYEQKIREASQNKPLCLHPSDLDAVHNGAVQAAMNAYDGRVRKISQKPDLKRIDLDQNFSNRLVQLRLTNDKNNKDAIRDIHSDYWKFMETKSVNPPMSDADFRGAHNSAFSQALAQLQARRNRPNSYPTDIYKEELSKIMNDTFWRLQAINQRKIEQENTRKAQERMQIEQERIRVEQERVRVEQERVRAEQEKIKYEQEMSRIQREKEEAEKERERLEFEKWLKSIHERCNLM